MKMAICYDFDKTLSPDDMQSFTLIPSFGMASEDFWRESNTLAREHHMDSNLAWMFQLLQYSRLKRLPVRREYFREVGAGVPLYPGVADWFCRMDAYAAERGVELEHYVISSGLKEIIEGTPIASCFRRIYASTYLYSADGAAEWPAQAVNYTNKTQYIFRIAKGVFEVYDERVNDSMPEEYLYIPYENIVYIGDSATDIPCMQLVKNRGGFSIGVYDPNGGEERRVRQLYQDGRLNFFSPADYTDGSPLSTRMKALIDAVAARRRGPG